MPSEQDTVNCRECGTELKNKYYLKKHYNSESNECTGEECRFCDRSDFVSQKGRKQHEAKMHDRPYKNRDVLKRLYIDERMGSDKIADKFDVSNKTIYDWLKKHDIEIRSHKEAITTNKANYYTDHWGYETWRAYTSEKYGTVRVHRLVAVAEYGFEAVSGNVVHHKNEVKWDNRPSNLKIMSDSEHKSLHAKNRTAD